MRVFVCSVSVSIFLLQILSNALQSQGLFSQKRSIRRPRLFRIPANVFDRLDLLCIHRTTETCRGTAVCPDTRCLCWYACLRNVSHHLADVIHGDHFVILEQFSKARTSRFHVSALCTTSRLTNAQAWDRFVLVYKDIMKLLLGGLSLEADTQEATQMHANPETDFRVLGIKVFKDIIFDKYQSKM